LLILLIGIGLSVFPVCKILGIAAAYPYSSFPGSASSIQYKTALFPPLSSNHAELGSTSMNTIVTALTLGTALWGALLMQTVGQPSQSPMQSSQSPSVQQIPVSPIFSTNSAVQITNGPVVENVTDTTAEIAWSTNVNAGTSLHYGTDSSHMDQTAGMPWGGLTHRVSLKNLKPNTTYFFKAASGEGQGTGTQAETGQSSFQTKPASLAQQN
jgi:hypothetical protein